MSAICRWSTELKQPQFEAAEKAASVALGLEVFLLQVDYEHALCPLERPDASLEMPVVLQVEAGELR